MKKEEKKEKKKLLLYAIITVTSFIVVSVTTAYAFYAATVVGNSEHGDINIKTGTPKAIAVFQNNIIDEEVLPGYTRTMNFSITNVSEEENAFGNYSIVWMINKKVDNEAFIYNLEGKTYVNDTEVSNDYSQYNKVVNINTSRVPTISSVLGTGIINTGVTHKYSLTISLVNNGEDQTKELNGFEFDSKVTIKSEATIE